MFGIELKLQGAIFLLTFQGQMRVFTVWPLFIWECKLNLVIRIDEMLGTEHSSEAASGAVTGRPDYSFVACSLGRAVDW